MPVSSVQYIDAGEAHITVPAYALYDITEPETLHIAIPAQAVMSRQPIDASDAVVVRAQSGGARLGGTLVFVTTKGPRVNVSEAYRLVFDVVDQGVRPELPSMWPRDFCALHEPKWINKFGGIPKLFETIAADHERPPISAQRQRVHRAFAGHVCARDRSSRLHLVLRIRTSIPPDVL